MYLSYFYFLFVYSLFIFIHLFVCFKIVCLIIYIFTNCIVLIKQIVTCISYLSTWSTITWLPISLINHVPITCFQIDLGRPTRVTAVVTQGRQDYDQWVTRYTLSYGNDGRDLTPYRVNGRIKVSIVIKYVLLYMYLLLGK